jgi:hypothetical protein
MSTTSSLLIDLLAAGAGLIFETMLIASLHVATAAGVLIALRRHPLLGALSGTALFAILAGLLVFGGPLATLRSYAVCVDRDSRACLANLPSAS